MAQRSCLIIDDSRTQLTAIMRMIPIDGWQAFIAESFDAARQYAAEEIELILLDVFLGKENGIDLLPDIRKIWPKATIAVMTAGDGDDDEVKAQLKRAKAQGVDHLVRKPFGKAAMNDLLVDAERIADTGRRLLHVLVVDDTRLFREMAATNLRKVGCRVSVAGDMETALEALVYDVIDVVMTDIFMPGMGGLAGTKIIRENYPGIGIIAMSGGFGELESEDALLAAHKVRADYCVAKPFDASQLKYALKLAMANPWHVP